MSPADRETLLVRLGAVLQSRPEVLEAYLFGSTARGESRAHSDIDVAVYLDPDSPAFGELTSGSLQRDTLRREPATPSLVARAAEIGAELGAVLGTNAIDVVALNSAPPLLYHRVLRDGIRIVSRDLQATTRRAGQALSRYCDYLPQLAKIDAAHHRRIAAGEFGR
ncbi:MAG: nucleotidyltransferase domain-containing protein [Thermoanaerobaculia bacterium]